MTNLETILSTEPLYRRKQIYSAWFDTKIRSYADITTLSKDLRAKLVGENYLSVKETGIAEDKEDNTYKTLLRLADGSTIETVLMGRINKKIGAEDESMRYTICVSSQVGCPMRCMFCATGQMGLKRDLSAQEIVDQFRFWNYFLADHDKNGKIDNMVLMGQGEPMLNYDNVKTALNLILNNTEIGPRQITVSTVGVKAGMEKMITDPEWPAVRFALSLHSALPETRSKLIPSHSPDFFEWLPIWAKKYHVKFTARTQFIGLEYIFLNGINDDAKHLKAFGKLASKLGRVRINLIPYNSTDPNLTGSPMETIEHWLKELMKKGLTVTIRRSQGQRIAAACGQLANKN